MKTVAGAILILSASVLAAAGIIADATMRTHGRLGNVSGFGYLAAVALGLFRLLLMIAGLGSDRHPVFWVWDGC